ncbi:bifunctional diaminohydroxyphosphoribosylaminopyrimidine deaminase/5-amino-6-(5-phosphoribosylamino)uracil reductase RibD [Gordonia sp. NB41Y]|uniref:bifunctional diaminohydroxyphosphoribosylaminopyrimidine deaminase/5-amino-6-(5-phosphoribosylamino)uracil reductase RibD n=1 Tax=Gordonia sp. NB41Y TaxID=875808 RepID=UPI00273A83D3|nr:bifunctional diaminohydroxyphosphoribosylaminopyrimidine deaminase/5-amino-6-(5-phosphoribosylamino)uracil reductase RibD [Gordonia sp. NB41Y]WLP90986.1 bifunctional diaminohydroxyphosphoribosylaminopyrimidine deaminase/5-amino-6-(5-phosphoribosylamino)uracil reductase RibD [Gordonia sp. NB41Y]
MTVAPDRLATAMRLAIDESAGALGLSRPNPSVGAVILADDGTEIARGHTQRAGGPHAEVMALRAAGSAARGATAVVTLEPCNHTGRTGPCAQALIDAGVATVVYAVGDPNPTASGGAARLRDAGIEVIAGLGERDAMSGPLRGWLFRQRHGRPLVTAKLAATLDGRIAAPDGTSQWITGARARARVHRQRAQLDAIIVGTGTVVRDDPALTARLPDGALADRQPIRVAMGHRDIHADARITSSAAGDFRHVRSHDPADVLAALPDTTWVLVEGGPRIIGAFLDAGLVDEIEAYVAPTVLGAGQSAIDRAAVTTLSDASRLRLAAVERIGDDVLLTARTQRLPD